MNRLLLVIVCLLLLQFGVAQPDQDLSIGHDHDQSNEQSNDYPVLNPSSGRPPVITGVSGCQYQSAVQTFNCPRPTLLTLTGSGFMTGLENNTYPTYYTRAYLTIPNTASTYWCTVLLDSSPPPSDTQLICSVAAMGFGQIVSDTWMDITFENTFTRNTSVLTNAVSFANEPAPRVDRVSGCEIISSDGRSASRCNFMNNLITLHGSGFRSVDNTYSILKVGSASNTIFLASNNRLIVHYTDDQIVFNFSASASYIQASELQSGAPLALHLEDGWDSSVWSTEIVYVSFIALPRPVVQSISKSDWSQGCKPDNSTDPMRYRDCISGLSILWLEGDYFFAPVTITIGGHPCQVHQGDTSFIMFNMPVFQSVEGTFYDLVVSTVAGSTTILKLIEFNHDPLISAVVPCINTGDWFEGITAHCRPTETLTLKMLNVKQTSVPRLWIRHLTRTDEVECPHVQLVDMGTINCVMPELPIGPQWRVEQAVYIYLQWQDGSKTEDVMVTQLWDPFNAPRLTSFLGCYSDSNDPLHLNQCLGQSPSGVLLTIHGVRFKPQQPITWTVAIGPSTECYRPIAMNNDTIICLLPNIDETFGQLSFDVKYSVFVSSFVSPAVLKSNAGYITFVQQETHMTSSSSTSTLTIALATVFSIVGAILLAGCLFMLCRSNLQHKRRASSRSSDSAASEFSNTGNHVELEEV